MRRAIGLSLGTMLLVSACSSGSEEASNSDAAQPSVPDSSETGSATEIQTMSWDEAGEWYEQAICTANTFGPVRNLVVELAEANQINVPVLRSAAPLYAASLEAARDSLLNPPAPWPGEVAGLVDERATLLTASAQTALQWETLSTPEEVLTWRDELIADIEEAAPVVDDIRFLLDLPEDSSCPDSTNPDVQTALTALEEDRTAIVRISCSGPGDSEDQTFFSLDEFWENTDEDWYGGYCTVDVEGFTSDTPTPEQREAMQVFTARYENGLDQEDAFSFLVENCLTGPSEGFRDMAEAQATLMFCPQSPYADIISSYAEGNRIDDDGSYVIGEEITAGTWRSTDSVSDCYWERTRPNGDTIANDFITFASGRVTVNISGSDGSFTTEGCGSWEKVQ